MRAILALTLLLISLHVFATGALGQGSVQDDEDMQSWNDIQITVPIEKKVDVFMKFTMRFGKNLSRITEGHYNIGFVLKPTKALSFSPYYRYVNARNSSGQFGAEHRLSVAATYKFPVKEFGLSHRSTIERRLREVGNTWRYRAMITVDKDIPEKLIRKAKWFVADEVFYDSATKRFSRNRFSVGINKTITKQLSLDLYYTRQNDGFSHPGDLNIIWSSWKIKL